MPPSPLPCRALRLSLRLAFALLLCAARHSFAAEPSTSAELLEALQGAVAQEVASNAAAEASGRGTGGSSNFSTVFQGIRQVREALESGNDREATQYLQSYVASNSRSAAVQKAVADLEARLRTERAAREAAVVAEADSAIASAGEAAVKSKTARELDPILAGLGKLRERYNSYNGNMGEERQRVGQRVSNALQSLRTWQDYLVAVEGKRPSAARNALQNLANNGEGGATLLPRSELIARMQALPDPSQTGDSPDSPAGPAVPLPELLTRLRTLDDIPAVLREFNLHQQSYYRENVQAASSLSSELDRLGRALVMFRAGMPLSLDLFDRSTNIAAAAYAGALAPLRAAFVRLALPRALGLPESTAIPPEETVAAFLRRAAAEARTAGNWPLVSRILTAERQLASATGPTYATSLSTEARGLDSFLAGRNQEAASQWSLAVASYQAALQSGSVDLPVREIGERLERIRREHPPEFAAGMESFQNPPSRPEVPPGVFPRPSGRSPVPLTVPAAPAVTPTPAPVASPSP